MSAPFSLQPLVERFVYERRRLGFVERNDAPRSFARRLEAIGHCGPVTLEAMTDWARHDSHDSHDPHTWALRLKNLRTFTRWLRQFEPATEVPDDSIFGPVRERCAPHIYTQQELADLLAAARRVGPPPGLRGLVYEALFGLIAACGLRLSEALKLRTADVDLRRGLLLVRQSKFGKSRWVPLHASTLEMLRRYCWVRDLALPTGKESPLFVGTRGHWKGQAVGGHEVDRVFRALCRQLGWRNRGKHHAPRIHDLRHTFVVRRLLLWHEQGVDLDQAMLQLSTYVGHGLVTNTYWYLSAVPELMALAGGRFESFVGQSQEIDHA